MKSLFSIIVPVYNVEKYLEECLDSIFNQSFKNYEVILVDDGSTDNSSIICDNYSLKYNNCKVLHKTNEGLVSARRVGLSLCEGLYVLFLDSDDYWDLDLLSKLNSIIEMNDGIDVITFRWQIINQNGVLQNITSPLVFSNSYISKFDYYNKLISSSDLNSLCLKCVKYDLFDVGFDYRPYYRFQNGEDLLQTIPIIEKAKSFYYLNEPLYYYRINTESLTHTYRKQQYESLNIVRPLLFESLKKQGLASNDSVSSFFVYYLNTIWNSLRSLYSNNLPITELLIAYKEIKSYRYVKEARLYLDKYNEHVYARLGLYLFYTNEYLFYIYMKSLVLLSKGIRKLI